jgi:fused signal recognition particle receptor
MFEKLKEKLGGFKKAFGQVLETKEKEAIITESAKVETAPKSPEKFGILDKIKAAVFEQEFIIEDSSVKDILWELEMALLESDVALPVAEKIVESIKLELVGPGEKLALIRVR